MTSVGIQLLHKLIRSISERQMAKTLVAALKKGSVCSPGCLLNEQRNTKEEDQVSLMHRCNIKNRCQLDVSMHVCAFFLHFCKTSVPMRVEGKSFVSNENKIL